MTWFNTALYNMGRGQIDLSTGTFKVALCSSLYVPATGTHDFLNDVTNVLATVTLAAPTWNTSAELIIADATITDPGTGTVTTAVFYKDTGVASTSPLIGFQTGLSLIFDGVNDTLDFPTTYTLRLLAV